MRMHTHTIHITELVKFEILSLAIPFMGEKDVS
jgi:hypothetical protein